MRFQPKTQQQLDEEARGPVLPAGDYEFLVKGATEKTSAKGNDMIALTLTVYGPGGVETTVWDYLLEAMGHKLLHFCEAADLVDDYNAGTLTADKCLNVHARCTLKIDPPKGTYAEKNAVEDYMTLGSGTPAAQRAVSSAARVLTGGAKPPKPAGDGYMPIAEDDIPF